MISWLAISILEGNFNSGRSYLITAVSKEYVFQFCYYFRSRETMQITFANKLIIHHGYPTIVFGIVVATGIENNVAT